MQLSSGVSTRWVGLLVLLICVSPQAHRWVRVENLSVIMGWIMGYLALQAIENKPVRAGAAMSIGAALKYATLVLLPLYAVMRRWSAIGWTIALSLAMFGASILIMGWQPYRIFITQIMPTLSRTSIPENQRCIAFF